MFVGFGKLPRTIKLIDELNESARAESHDSSVRERPRQSCHSVMLETSSPRRGAPNRRLKSVAGLVMRTKNAEL